MILCAMLFSVIAAAQNKTEEKVMVDSLVYRQASAVDSALVGKSIFNLLTAHDYGTGDVKIHQSQAITGAMKQHIAKNPARTLTGYRVRIFFDNSKNARGMSENIMRTFRMNYLGVPAYRNYQNPFFRVVAGDFRTKSEAMEFLQKIKSSYPSAIVVKENIKFPAVDKEHNYVVDTVMVARPAANL